MWLSSEFTATIAPMEIPAIWCGFIVIVQFTIKSHQIDVIIKLNDGISIGAIVAVNLHDNHII